jgi:hypothetical protein
MFQVRFGAFGRGVLGVGVVGIALAGACAEKKGAIMLAINTDMKAPKDVNAVSVTISTNGAVKHSFIGRVTPQGEVLLPATLAIVEPEDASASIRVRVMAFQNQRPRVLRDVRTTVPRSGRTALLRIPLNFVNDGSTKSAPLPDGVLPDPVPGTGGTTRGSGGLLPRANPAAGEFDFFSSFQPDCPDFETQTWIDGECKDNYVDSSALPDFDSALIGDSTDVGSCFDPARCFANAIPIGEVTAPPSADGGADVPDGGTATPPAAADAGAKAFKDFRPSAVTLDRGACTIQLNGADPARLNLALVTPDAGECVRPNECYIPLDRGADGWQDANGKVRLPAYVCRLLASKGLRLATSTDTCAAKEAKNPICASKVGDLPAPAAADASSDAGRVDLPTFGIPEELATSVAAVNGTLFFASASRVGTVNLIDATALPQPIPGITASELPWRFGHPSTSSVAVLTNGTTDAYQFSGVDPAPTTVTLPSSVLDGTDLPSSAEFAWVAGVGTGEPGVFKTTPASPSAGASLVSLLEGTTTLTLNPTAIASVPGTPAVVIGELGGAIRLCLPNQSYWTCGPPTSAPGSRIDGLMARPGAVNAGYGLAQGGVYKSTIVDVATGSIQGALLRAGNTAGISSTAGQYYRRGLAANAACVFYTTDQGVEWALDDGKGGGVLVPAAGRTLLGVALGPALSSTGASVDAIYYTVFAPRAQGGGVYRVPVNLECGGTGGGGADGGAAATPDAGVAVEAGL